MRPEPRGSRGIVVVSRSLQSDVIERARQSTCHGTPASFKLIAPHEYRSVAVPHSVIAETADFIIVASGSSLSAATYSAYSRSCIYSSGLVIFLYIRIRSCEIFSGDLSSCAMGKIIRFFFFFHLGIALIYRIWESCEWKVTCFCKEKWFGNEGLGCLYRGSLYWDGIVYFILFVRAKIRFL